MKKATATSKNTSRRTGDATLEQYFSWVTRQPLLAPEEEQLIANAWVATRAEEHKEHLVNANLRFVAKVAFEYENYGFPILDLIQEGNVGLVRAVDNFDPARGYRLISYAVWWIRACIHDYILKNWSLVKLGTTQKQRAMFNRLVSSRKRMDKVVGTETPRYHQEIAESVGTSPRAVQEFEARMRNRPVHLDDHAGSGDERSLSYHELLASEEDDAEQVFGDEQLAHSQRQALSQAIQQLPEREQLIVRSRHLGDRKATFRELGDELGVSKERVRQLEARALTALRSCLEANFSREELLAA